MTGKVARIVLAGCTADVWPVAALLARELPKDIALHVVDSGRASGAQAATVPLSSDYHTRAGIDCADLFSKCHAFPSLGSVLENWSGEGTSLVTAPSGSLPMIGGVPLHQFVLKIASEGGSGVSFAQAFEPFRFASRAASAGKMALPTDAPDSPLAMLGPQVSLGRADYAAMLKARCESRCILSQGTIVAAEQHDGGAIANVTLSDGTEISGDFFVDCTGDLSVLTNPTEDLTQVPIAPFDRIATAETERGHQTSMPTYRAQQEGMLAIIPGAERQYVAFAYPSATSDEIVAQIVGDNAVTAPFSPGSTDTPWQHNLARLGTASAQLIPMLSADMALLQAQAVLLADCLPAITNMQAEADAFNARHAETLVGITDFALAPFHLNRRDEKLWRDIRAAAPSGSLQTRIDQFRARGRVPTFERNHTDEQTWTEYLTGLGVEPARHDRRTEAFPPAQVARILQTIRQQLDAAIERMETQAHFMTRFV